jgi:hypothetical protein
MNAPGAARAIEIAKLATEQDPRGSEGSSGRHSEPQQVIHGHLFFQALWFAANVLLILSILMVVYSAVWEYSTRRYLRGFADAVVPASATPEQKTEAILHWMSNGPARLESNPAAVSPTRDPVETLNYASLLRVCGSATNAFVNLADSARFTARRLLLLDSHQMTKHVVAEVLVGDRWIVVDPAFRVILRDAGGRYLTRQQLTDSAVFAAATNGIRGYNPAYTFDRTSHIRLSRLGPVGHLLRYTLDRLLPGWDDSATMTLMLERQSFTALVISVALAMFLILLRIFLGWYADTRLKIRRLRVRRRLTRVRGAFLNSAEGD